MRWSGEPLLEFLSRYGIIPTYSFPVNSIRLEVLSDRNFGKAPWDQEIHLDRDARIGIVEYAPGAEVVANGRVWVSCGIAHQPRQFRRESFYRECQVCRHLETHLDRDAIGRECPNCGAGYSQPVRSLLERRGFITYVTDQDGRRPGKTRLKSPPAQETSLITSAAESAFDSDTGILNVSWALLPARDGKKLIINRGKSQGFKRCRCGYTKVIKGDPFRFRLDPHDDPYTGLRCTQGPNSHLPAQDLGHEFHTDVLQIRIDHAPIVPAPLLVAIEEEMAFRNGLARTFTEACKLALARLLRIDETEVAASYRWRLGGGVELIIYDSVPGGAGYVRRFFTGKTGVLDLLRKACEKSCTVITVQTAVGAVFSATQINTTGPNSGEPMRLTGLISSFASPMRAALPRPGSTRLASGKLCAKRGHSRSFSSSRHISATSQNRSLVRATASCGTSSAIFLLGLSLHSGWKTVSRCDSSVVSSRTFGIRNSLGAFSLPIGCDPR